MSEQITIIVIGALVGLFPTLLATVIKWLEKRDLAAKQNRALDLAKQRVEYLNGWIKVQEAVCSPEQLAEIKQDVSLELVQINRTLREELVEEKDELVTFEERNALQRWFLLYNARSGPGWVFHILFYMFLGIQIIALVSGFGLGYELGYEEHGWSLSNLIAEWIILSPLVVLIPLMRWFAVRADRAADAKLEAQYEREHEGKHEGHEGEHEREHEGTKRNTKGRRGT